MYFFNFIGSILCLEGHSHGKELCKWKDILGEKVNVCINLLRNDGIIGLTLRPSFTPILQQEMTFVFILFKFRYVRWVCQMWNIVHANNFWEAREKHFNFFDIRSGLANLCWIALRSPVRRGFAMFGTMSAHFSRPLANLCCIAPRSPVPREDLRC